MSSSSNSTNNGEENDSEVIISTYKRMSTECQQIASKISELNMDKEEHRLVVDTLSKLEPERKAFRLVGGVLMERTVADVRPIVERNFDGIKELLEKLDASLQSKDSERRAYKEKHGIMTQEEREAMMRKEQRKLTQK